MIKIDAIGRKILHELSSDGRISNLELADRVGLSPSACLRRVQELERGGVIKGYRAVIDPAKLGLTFLAYVTVGLSSHTKKSQVDFEAAMAGAPEVRECHNITGTIEYLLRVETEDLAPAQPEAVIEAAPEAAPVEATAPAAPFSILDRVVRLIPARSARSCAVRPRSSRPMRIILPSMISASRVTRE